MLNKFFKMFKEYLIVNICFFNINLFLFIKDNVLENFLCLLVYGVN